MCAVFESPTDAAKAARAATDALAAEPWEAIAGLRARVGIHTGDAVARGADYFGATLNCCARLMAAAHGGQIVMSAATETLLDGEVIVRDLGEHRLRDLVLPVHVFQLGPEEHPPLRTAGRPERLPSFRSRFIGRAEDIDRLSMLLEEHRRSPSPASEAAARRGWPSRLPRRRHRGCRAARSSWTSRACPTPA